MRHSQNGSYAAIIRSAPIVEVDVGNSRFVTGFQVAISSMVGQSAIWLFMLRGHRASNLEGNDHVDFTSNSWRVGLVGQ
jgi:hypothetical protein